MTVDVVITWVDGNDPVHQAKRSSYLTEDMPKAGTETTRFASSGELYFAVASVFKYCPFVRKIHVITDAQHPRMLDPFFQHETYGSRLNIVDHTEIFGEHADLLPVFSSLSIETMMHRVPGLAERYIYLNDDVFFGRPLNVSDFFDGDLPILRGTLRRYPPRILEAYRARFKTPHLSFKRAQRASAKRVGRVGKYLLAEHHPHVMRTDALRDFYSDKVSEMREQASFRFRSPAQLSSVALCNHIELARGARVIAADAIGYIVPKRTSLEDARKTMNGLMQNKLFSLCVQSLDLLSPEYHEVIMEGLHKHYRLPGVGPGLSAGV